MFLVTTVDREKAQGAVADAYSLIPAQVDLPVPLVLLSASPGLLERQAAMVRYFRTHERLSPALQASLRYVASERFGHSPCALFNHALLRAQGMSDEDIANLSCKPTKALDETEAALLAFVTRAIDDPRSVTRAQIDALLAEGWREADIVDATQVAANMLGLSLMYKTFVRD